MSVTGRKIASTRQGRRLALEPWVEEVPEGVQEALQQADERIHKQRQRACHTALRHNSRCADPQGALFPFEQMVLDYSPQFNDTVTSKGGTIVTHGGIQYVSTQTLLDARVSRDEQVT